MPLDEEGNEIDIIGEVDGGYESIEKRMVYSKEIDKLKKVLTQREWKILYATAILEHDQFTVACIFNIQQPHVSRLLKKIRTKVINSEFNPTFLR